LSDTIDLKRYAETVPEGSPRRAIYIEAGRGCPFACTFCATAPFWERKYRVKPVQRLIEEMRFLYEQYGYNGFMLVHDLLTVDKQFIYNFSEALIESRLPVEWMANHRTDIDLHGLLPKMKTAGCWAMFFGIESGSARLQKTMHKGLKREGVVSTIRGLCDLGIASTCSFVIGFPDETPDELSLTIATGAELKLIGAGLVQFHRLRIWPPAPLSYSKLPAQFDVDSLRIEYPFVDVPQEDVAAIESDPDFFAGYFAPYSQAGTFAQLAQVELFFTQAVAAAPLTIAVLGRLLGGNLVESFYDLVSVKGAITRAEIEAADTSSMLPLWLILRPFLEQWVAEYPTLEDWQRELVRGAMLYEEQRLRFVVGDGSALEDMAENWGAFVSKVDIAALFDAMQAEQPLKPELVQKSGVVFVCYGANYYRAYSTDASQIADLHQHPLFNPPAVQ
jgi:Radical SAM superfamily